MSLDENALKEMEEKFSTLPPEAAKEAMQLMSQFQDAKKNENARKFLCRLLNLYGLLLLRDGTIR